VGKVRVLCEHLPCRGREERTGWHILHHPGLTTQREMERALLSYITETALRLKNPVELVGTRLNEIIDQIESHSFTDEDICLQLKTQVKNIEQIVQNLHILNQAIVEGKSRTEEANIIGITPAWLTRSGINVL